MAREATVRALTELLAVFATGILAFLYQPP